MDSEAFKIFYWNKVALEFLRYHFHRILRQLWMIYFFSNNLILCVRISVVMKVLQGFYIFQIQAFSLKTSSSRQSSFNPFIHCFFNRLFYTNEYLKTQKKSPNNNYNNKVAVSTNTLYLPHSVADLFDYFPLNICFN